MLSAKHHPRPENVTSCPSLSPDIEHVHLMKEKEGKSR